MINVRSLTVFLAAAIAISGCKAEYDPRLSEKAWQEIADGQVLNRDEIKTITELYARLAGEYTVHFSYHGALAISQNPDGFVRWYSQEKELRDLLDYCVVAGPKYALTASGKPFPPERKASILKAVRDYCVRYPSDVDGVARMKADEKILLEVDLPEPASEVLAPDGARKRTKVIIEVPPAPKP